MACVAALLAAALACVPATVADGTVYAIGDNMYCQLGIGTLPGAVNTHVDTLAEVAPHLDVTAVAAGYVRTAFLTSSGEVHAVGMWAGIEPRLITVTLVPTPSDRSGVPVVAIDSGNDHLLMLYADGQVYLGGRTDAGPCVLSDGSCGECPGSVPDVWTPQLICGLGSASAITAVSAGERHSMYLDADGVAWVSGLNSAGQLGDNSTTDRAVPFAASPPGGNPVISVAAGRQHSVLVDSSGVAYGTGDNALGQLGDGSTTNRSVWAAIPLPDTAVAAFGHSQAQISAFVSRGGLPMVMGENGHGQLGLGFVGPQHTAAEVTTVGSDIASITLGRFNLFFIASDGRVSH